MRAYLDSLSMDGAEVAVNCLCSARSCATCWCPDSELADGHRGECHYRRMAEVMEQLDAARGDGRGDGAARLCRLCCIATHRF